MWLAFYVHNLDPFLVRFYDDVGIRWYGTAYLAGFVAAFYLLKWLARKGYGSLQEAQVPDFVFFAAIFGVLVGGRLGYVLFYRPHMILDDPLGIFRVWDGGMGLGPCNFLPSYSMIPTCARPRSASACLSIPDWARLRPLMPPKQLSPQLVPIRRFEKFLAIF